MKINSFLKKIAQDMKTNLRILDKDDFYYILKYIGVEKNTSLAEDIETFYQDFLNSLNDSLVKYNTKEVKSGENKTNYIGFYVDEKAPYDHSVKVYFPVKYEYMNSALKTVFVYLIRNNVKSIVKFHEKATNENIVIHFYEKSDVLPFIRYCSNNFVLDDLLENVNPFIATVKGFGIVYDDNSVSTYNQTLSILLEKYFRQIAHSGAYDKVSDLDFLDFVINEGEKVDDERLAFDIKAIENGIRSILLNTNPLD